MITTEHDAERIEEIRGQSGVLVTIGACATSGGILQALRNLADLGDLASRGRPLTRAAVGVADIDPDR